jgi:hypothetical protein
VLVLAAAPASASAAMRLAVTGPRLASAGHVRVGVAGARPGARAVFAVVLDGTRVPVGTRRTDRRGRAGLTVSYDAILAAVTAGGLVGPIDATVTVVVHGRSAAARLRVRGLDPDPLSLAVLPAGAIGYDQALALRVAGLRPVGPPVEIRFTDCAGTVQLLVVPRTGAAVDVSLAPGVAPRTAIELTCFDGAQPEYAFPFTVGVVLADGFVPVATASATLLPPPPN